MDRSNKPRRVTRVRLAQLEMGRRDKRGGNGLQVSVSSRTSAQSPADTSSRSEAAKDSEKRSGILLSMSTPAALHALEYLLLRSLYPGSSFSLSHTEQHRYFDCKRFSTLALVPLNSTGKGKQLHKSGCKATTRGAKSTSRSRAITLVCLYPVSGLSLSSSQRRPLLF